MESQPGKEPPVDGALIARVTEGDEEALGALYDRHGGSAYSLAYAICGDSADAEEAVADAFLYVWRRASSFDAGRGNVAAWLMTITRSRAIDRIRAQSRHGRFRADARNADRSPSPPAAGVDQADVAEQLDARRLAARLLAELTDEQRQAIELAYLGGMTHSEIAAELGEPLGTVKTRLRAGMRRLRDALQPLLEVRT